MPTRLPIQRDVTSEPIAWLTISWPRISRSRRPPASGDHRSHARNLVNRYPPEQNSRRSGQLQDDTAHAHIVGFGLDGEAKLLAHLQHGAVASEDRAVKLLQTLRFPVGDQLLH